MKYIRTKDGIITDKLYEQALEICALTYENAQKTDLKVINQADTVEELCDRFIYDEDIYFPEIVNGCLQTYDYEAIDYEITEKKIKQGIYGAIWTDKGLIYVAKMNKKGELELL